jgi:hypothetical protein
MLSEDPLGIEVDHEDVRRALKDVRRYQRGLVQSIDRLDGALRGRKRKTKPQPTSPMKTQVPTQTRTTGSTGSGLPPTRGEAKPGAT